MIVYIDYVEILRFCSKITFKINLIGNLKLFLFTLDDAFFQPELGWSAFGLLGRSWADIGLVCRSCVVGPRVGPLLLIGRLWM